MIVSDVVTRVQRQFGDEASVQISSDDIIRWINDCAKDLAVNNDLGQASAIQASQIGIEIYTVPADSFAIRSVYYNQRKLDFYTRQEYDAYINANDPTESASGTPILYTRHVNDLLLYPVPNEVQNIKIWYFQRPTPVALTTDTLPFSEEYHNRIVEYCLMKAYQTDEDWDSASQMQNQFDDGVTRLKQLEDADDQEFYPSITVLPEDSGYY